MQKGWEWLTLQVLPLKSDCTACVSGVLPVSSSGVRQELQCDVTAHAGYDGWWSVFYVCVILCVQLGWERFEEYNLVGRRTRWALLHHWSRKMNESQHLVPPPPHGPLSLHRKLVFVNFLCFFFLSSLYFSFPQPRQKGVVESVKINWVFDKMLFNPVKETP